ncbi:MAG: hypothetical protein GF353_27020, partial [Candidatus Lokiarchaeota archaeon]|nr:hypothetical protein [Candidatus Lokiarchaeota archaeon]
HKTNSTDIVNELIKLVKNIYGFDINEIAVKLSILKIIKWIFEKFGFISSKINKILIKNIRKKNIIIDPIDSKYDLVVGNPPYGNILSEKEKQILKTQNIFNKDIYCAFILKVLEFNPRLVSFLVPKSFLLRESYLSFRTQLLSNTNILRIYDIGSNQFRAATNEVAVIIYEKKYDEMGKPLKVFDYPDESIITYDNQQVDCLKICLNKDCLLINRAKKFSVYTSENKCPICKKETIDLNRIRIKPSEEIFRLINKIEDISNLNFLNVRDFPQMKRGEEDIGLREVKKKLTKNLQGSCYFVDAKQDFQYYHLNPRQSFNIEEIDDSILKGKNYEYYIKSKLLIKHNNIVPEAIYSEDQYCFTSSIYSLLNPDLKMLKFLCAIMNSALIQFYCIYAINNQKNTTINLNQYMIRHLPVKKPNKIVKNIMSVLVDSIIAYLQTRNGTYDNKAYNMFREIDQKIFDLYKLNKFERKLIIEDVRKNISFFSKVYSN